mgnify:CR=1 FL=1
MTTSNEDAVPYSATADGAPNPGAPAKSEGTALSWVLALFGTAMGAGIPVSYTHLTLPTKA